MFSLIATLFAALIIAAKLGPLAGLAALFWLVPFAGMFFAADEHLLRRWRVQILESWALCMIDFHALANAMRALSTMPKSTVDGMFETLPQMSDLAVEQELSGQTRRLIALLTATDSQYRVRAQFLKLFIAIASASVTTIAIVYADFFWMLAMAPFALLALALRQYWRVSPSKLIAECRSLSARPTCDVDSACAELGRLATRRQLDARWIDLIQRS